MICSLYATITDFNIGVLDLYMYIVLPHVMLIYYHIIEACSSIYLYTRVYLTVECS